MSQPPPSSQQGAPTDAGSGAGAGGPNIHLVKVFNALPMYFEQVEKKAVTPVTALSLRRLIQVHTDAINSHFSAKGLPSPLKNLPDALNPAIPLTGEYAEEARRNAAAAVAAAAQTTGEGGAGVGAGQAQAQAMGGGGSAGSGASTPGSVGGTGGTGAGAVRPGVVGQQRPGPGAPGNRPNVQPQPQAMKLFPPPPGTTPQVRPGINANASASPNPSQQSVRPTPSPVPSQGSVPQVGQTQGQARPVLPQAQVDRKPSIPTAPSIPPQAQSQAQSQAQAQAQNPTGRQPLNNSNPNIKSEPSSNPTLPHPPAAASAQTTRPAPNAGATTGTGNQTMISMQLAPGGKYTWGEISQMTTQERERWFIEEPNGRSELTRILAEIRKTREEAAARAAAAAAAAGGTAKSPPTVGTTANTAPGTGLTTNNLAGVTKTPAGVRDPNAAVASYLASLPPAVTNLTLPAKGAAVGGTASASGIAGPSTSGLHRLQINIPPESQFHFLTTLKTIPSFPTVQSLDEKGVQFFLRLTAGQAKQLSNTHRELRDWVIRTVQRKQREDEMRGSVGRLGQGQDFKIPQTPLSGSYGMGGPPVTNRSTIQNIVMEIQKYKEKEPRGITLDTVKEMCRRAGVTFTMELEKAVEPLCVKPGVGVVAGPMGPEEWMEGNVRDLAEDVLGESLPSSMEQVLISLTSSRFDAMLDSACRAAKTKKRDEVPGFKDLTFALRNDYGINTHAYASDFSTFNLKRKAAEASEREGAKKARTNLGGASAVTATTGASQ